MGINVDPADPVVVDLDKEQAYAQFWKLVPYLGYRQRLGVPRDHLDDLFQEGWIGVEYALRYYSGDKGMKISSFVAAAIVWSMRNAKEDWLFQKGYARNKRGRRMTTVSIEELSYGTGSEAAHFELAAKECRLGSRRDARRLFDQLTPYARRREKAVAAQHYLRGVPLETLAASLGCSRQRVYQIVAAAFLPCRKRSRPCSSPRIYARDRLIELEQRRGFS